MTRRSPDQTSSIAQTLLSTRPVGRATSRTTSSVMSVGTLAARFGQATHSPPAGAIRSRRLASRVSSSARQITKNTITSSGSLPDRSRRGGPTPGSPLSLPATLGGPPRTATSSPGLMPSLRGNGVPEYPASGAMATFPAPVGLQGRPGSPLAVLFLVAAVERVDLVRCEWFRLAVRAGEVHGAGHVLAHHRGLDRVAGGRPDGEHPVAAHQHRRGTVAGEGGHDAPADVVPADERERPDRDLAAELVRHRGEHARDGFAPRRPGGGVGGVGVHDPADAGHVP